MPGTARALPHLLISRGHREIGPIGTASRVLGGLVAIALPIALAGFTWWDAAIALVALPLIPGAPSCAQPLVADGFVCRYRCLPLRVHR